MQVTSATNSTSQSAYATGSQDGTASRIPVKTLGSQDFMKLLAVQFQSQDPMKPMEDTAFIAQLTSFTSLEQMNSLTKEIGLMRSDQQKYSAGSYLGRVATMQSGKETISGEITAVDTSGTTPSLRIGGKYYPITDLLHIEAAPVLNPASSTIPQSANQPAA